MSDRSLSKAEMSALLESAKSSPRDYSMLAFARLTGLRVSELVRVRFEDLSPAVVLGAADRRSASVLLVAATSFCALGARLRGTVRRPGILSSISR